MRRRVLGAAVSVSLLAACAPATSAASRATQTAQARAFATHSGVLAASGDVRAYCRLVGQVHNGKGRSYTIAPVSYSACRQALFTGLARFKSGEFARMGVALEHERRHLNVRTVAAGDIEVTAIDGADHVRVGLDVAFYRQRAFLISIEDSAPGFFTGTVF